ncbi:MAG TPA: DNA gyrase inhibitor YacG [Rhizobiales bacterium]|nr:zinc-binding protein [bacterium BMS3Bbin10]HDO51489.1 DNA gyrase inhibitor YacG [Hyphomicrobiales bacterium]
MKPVDKAPGGGGGPNKRNGKSRCALCAKPVVEQYSPFCSKHCADIDLGRWLKGQYAVPGLPGDGDETPSGEQ